MSTTSLRIKVEDETDLIAAHEAAEATGVSLREVTAKPTGGIDQQVAPVVAVLIGAGVVAGVKMIMNWWEQRKGGLVVDLRPEVEDTFYRDRDLPYGYVATRSADGGKVTVDVKDSSDSAEKWINTVIEASFKTVDQLAKTAESMFDASKVVVERALD